jgi:hypothetical protein
MLKKHMVFLENGLKEFLMLRFVYKSKNTRIKAEARERKGHKELSMVRC